MSVGEDRQTVALVARLDSLLSEPHVSADYVRFRIELVQAQRAVCAALGTPAAATHPLKPTPHVDGRPYVPPLPSDLVPFPAPLLASLAAALGRIVHQHGRVGTDLVRLVAAAETERGLWEDLACRVAFGPDGAFPHLLAQRLEVSAEALVFFGRVLAAPFVTDAARRYLEQGGAVACAPGSHGQCVLCGSAPALARLRRDDGGRILHCSLCAAAYEYVRLACPHCGTRDPAALTFLRLSQNAPRWVESCARCRAYIKTVDERKLLAGEEVIPLVEDARTLHLDLLAEQEGCRRGLPYAAVG